MLSVNHRDQTLQADKKKQKGSKITPREEAIHGRTAWEFANIWVNCGFNFHGELQFNNNKWQSEILVYQKLHQKENLKEQ